MSTYLSENSGLSIRECHRRSVYMRGKICALTHRYPGNKELLLKSVFCKSYFIVEVQVTADIEETESPQKAIIEMVPALQESIRKFLLSSEKVWCIVPKGQMHSFILLKTGRGQSVSATLDTLSNMLENEKVCGEYVYADRLTDDTQDMLLKLLTMHFKNVYYYSDTPVRTISCRKYEEVFPLDFTPSELLKYMKQRIKGQDRAIEQAVMFVMEYLRAASSGGDVPNHALNWFLTAPSGMGKTEFYRALRDFLKEHNVPVPVVQIDLSQITETGFKGNNVDFFTDMILEQKGLKDGTAICFLDEADKKFMPSYSSQGVNCNALVQNNLLTVIEGTMLDSRDGEQMIDTNKTMFVLMGAFQNIRSKKRHEAKQNERLFKAKDSEKSQKALYSDITIDDMIEEGMLEELAGRITSVVNMDIIPKNVMRKLLAEKAEQIAEEFGISIEITEAGMEALTGISYTNLGVRTPVSRIRSEVVRLLSTVYFTEAYDSRNVTVLFNGLDDVFIIKTDSSGMKLPDWIPYKDDRDKYHDQISC